MTAAVVGAGRQPLCWVTASAQWGFPSLQRLQDRVVWVCGSPIAWQSLDYVLRRLPFIYMVLHEGGPLPYMASAPISARIESVSRF
jgi:hypothetical protein